MACKRLAFTFQCSRVRDCELYRDAVKRIDVHGAQAVAQHDDAQIEQLSTMRPVPGIDENCSR